LTLLRLLVTQEQIPVCGLAAGVGVLIEITCDSGTSIVFKDLGLDAIKPD
jgi:hypothetical protein